MSEMSFRKHSPLKKQNLGNLRLSGISSNSQLSDESRYVLTCIGAPCRELNGSFQCSR